MTFCLEFSNDYYQELEFFCAEKEVAFCVDISGAYDKESGEYDDEKVEEIVRDAFNQAFGEGVSWEF